MKDKQLIHDTLKIQFTKYQEIIDNQNKVIAKLSERYIRDHKIIDTLKRDIRRSRDMVLALYAIITILVAVIILIKI